MGEDAGRELASGTAVVLRQQVELYRVYPEKIAACNRQWRKHPESFGSKVDLPAQPLGPKPKGKKGSRGSCVRPAHGATVYRITGIDWAQINRMDVITAQTVIAEAGANLSAFPSQKQFAERGLSERRLDTDTKPKLPGSAIQAAAHSSRRSQGHYRNGSKASLSVLPAPQARTAARRQGNRILRIRVSRTTDPVSDKTRKKLGLQVVIPQTA